MTPNLESLEAEAVAVLDHIEQYFREKAQETKQALPAPEVPPSMPDSEPDPAPVSEVTLSIILSYPAAKDAEVRKAIATLKELCTTFAVRKR